MQRLIHKWMSGTIVIVLSILCLHAQAQSQAVSGKVKDAETGEALPGVNVIIKGTTNGTTTDGNGAFSIKASSSDVLVFSFIGYKAFEVEVGAQASLDVSLEVDAQSLTDIVVVGYGTQKKSHLTGAVASTNMESYLKIPTGDALNALQGQVAGVNIYNATGAPGATPIIQIRGLGTINGSSPLFVIDGIPSEISYINPAEIESINVLKDASAATIYGARGANGVVLITTKKGASGKPQISVNSFVGLHQVNLNGIDMVTTSQKNQIMKMSYDRDAVPYPDWIKNDNQFANTNWVDAYFKTAVEQKYDVNIAGGTDQVSYNFSGGYYNHSGTVINTGMNRYNNRLSLEFKDLANGRLKISTGVAYIKKNTKNFSEPLSGGNADFSPLMSLYTTLPHKKIYDPTSINGYAGRDAELAVAGAGPLASGNIIGQQNLQQDKNQNDYAQLNLGADYKLFDWLTYQFKIGFNSENTYNDFFLPQYDFGPGATVETTRLFETRARTNASIMNNLLNFSKQFNQHSLNILLGTAAEKYERRSVGGSNLILPAPSIHALNPGTGTKNSYGTNVTNTILSFFTRASYNFADKYFLEGSIRRDGSSRFGPENRWGTFYGFSAGWALHRENFFNSNFISELKPRASYGVVGNQDIPDFQYLSLIATGGDYVSMLNYPFGMAQNISAGATAVSVGNSKIKWEQTATQNYGLDMSVLGNKVSLTVDYFNSKTTGMLVPRFLPETSGVTTAPYSNLGDLTNKGFELTLTYRKQTGDFKFNVQANVGSSKNTVTKLGYEGQQIVDGYVEYNNYPTTKTQVGKTIGTFYLAQVAGIFKTQAEIDAYQNKDGDPMQPNAKPGDFKFTDVNGDGYLDDKDKKDFGSGFPKAIYGLNFNGSWKNFDFSVMMNGTAGNKMYNGFKTEMYRLGASSDLLKSWSPERPNSKIATRGLTDANNNYTVSSNYFLENASYLRVRNVQIGYSLPASALGKSGISRTRIYVSLYNPITITKYSGFDPGLINYSKFSRGVDRGFYPLSKSLVFGLSIGL